MPNVEAVEVLLSLLVVGGFLLPFYKVIEERGKTRRKAEEAERKEKKEQADQLHQRINTEKDANHKNECRICTLEGYNTGYKEGKAEARAEAKQK